MKKIINGKLYDTDTAEWVGFWSSGDPGDLYCVEETLYRKKTGEYFLYVDGGAAIDCEIICEAEFNPREWAEKHVNADTYISFFGPVKE